MSPKRGLEESRPGGTEHAVRAEINVTPLVDVCLVLLIIFMVITPLLQQGVDVALPETEQPEKMPEGQKQLDVAIRADGNVFVGQTWVRAESLQEHLAEVYAQTPDRDVVLKADRLLRYKEVRQVMRAINEAGFRGVGLVTLKRDAS
jgi:biopolymer transport protein ExbD